MLVGRISGAPNSDSSSLRVDHLCSRESQRRCSGFGRDTASQPSSFRMPFARFNAIASRSGAWTSPMIFIISS